MSDEIERPEDQWWYPTLTDEKWVARIRADYPGGTADLSDEGIRDHYAEGAKYADTWDHLGDARDQFEKLADAYLALRAERDAALAEVERLRAALEHLIERADTSDDCQYGTLSTAYVRDIARAALESKHG